MKCISPDNTQRLIRPKFKFTTAGVAEKMLNHGSIRISPMNEFRKSYHGGLIHDSDEGRVRFHGLQFDESWRGFAKTAPVDLGDFFIYCTTSHIFSETLQWALKENNRESCILITDISALHKAISQAVQFDLDFLGQMDCRYNGRDFYGIFNPESIVRHQIARNLAAWSKPSEFQDQAEYRGVWSPLKPLSKCIDKKISEIRNYLIPVDISDIDRGFRFDRVLIEIKTAKSVLRANLKYDAPVQSYSPVIFNGTDGQYLGIRPRSNLLEAAEFETAHMDGELGPLINGVKLSDVVSIKYTSIFDKK